MLDRHVTSELRAALADTPVCLLVGARQTGKSTLCRELAGDERRYISFDDASSFASARSDPEGFVSSLEGRVVLDEVQRVPELFRAMKLEVDRRRDPGRFLLTGSANVLLLPKLAESLAGRMEVLTLWPLSQGEIEGRREGFVDHAFSRTTRFNGHSDVSRGEILSRVFRGGYPEILKRSDAGRRRAWFESYLTTMLQRDIRDLANVEDITVFPRLLGLIAARVPAALNFADLARDAGLPQTTLKRYLSLLAATFLVKLVPAWSTNPSKRFVKTPRLVMGDTGLLAHTAAITPARLKVEPTAAGRLLENFVVMELVKQASFSRARPGVFYFRTHSGLEVDTVLESEDGRVVGVEIKAAPSVGASDFRGLTGLKEAAGKRFHRGFVLYAGREVLPFGAGMWAVPIAMLWAQPAS